MSTDCPRPRCRWFVRRLPLLSDGELIGTERCKIERHLIACPDCRRRHAALAGVLDVLHAAAAEAPTTASAALVTSPSPSLWPALQRQIREERHASRAVVWGLGSWADALAGWFRSEVVRPSRRRWRTLSLLATSLVLMALAAESVELWAQWRVATLLEAARQPVVPSLEWVLAPEPSAIDPAPGSVLVSESSLTPPAVASTRPSQVDYDLDTGTPMGPAARTRDAKASY